jgi:hypothetical protein
MVGVPAVVLLAALCFGVVLPRLKRARQQEMGITLAAFSDASLTAPPRPSRPVVVEQAPVAPPIRAEPID